MFLYASCSASTARPKWKCTTCIESSASFCHRSYSAEILTPHSLISCALTRSRRHRASLHRALVARIGSPEVGESLSWCHVSGEVCALAYNSTTSYTDVVCLLLAAIPLRRSSALHFEGFRHLCKCLPEVIEMSGDEFEFFIL